MLKIEMACMLMAFAAVLSPIARGQSIPQPKITGVLTTLTPKRALPPSKS